MVVRFLHIPKTAGTTFERILSREYSSSGKQFSFTGNIKSDVIRYQNLSDAERRNIVLFLGHAPIWSGIPAADSAQIVTFLRDPVKRVQSFCQHVSVGKSPHLRDLYPPDAFDLNRFLDSGDEELSNFQTKMLVFRANPEKYFSLDGLDLQDVKRLAMDTLLRRINCFGLQDFFDESLILFSSSLKWRALPFYRSANVKSNANLLKFSPEHIEKIKELNSIDIALYQEARDHFMQTLQSERFDRRKFQIFHSLQNMLSRFFALSRKKPK
jgi:hypothetical protein